MPADLVILNANIQTMDQSRPQAQAILIRAGRIVTLGTTAEVLSLADPHTRTLDAGGRLVLPGFQDAHVHLLDGGADMIHSAWLGDATSLAELQSALAAHATTNTNAMIMGGGWRAAYFGDANLTRHVLDAVVTDRPCIVFDDSAHNACLNSQACEMVGLTRETPDPTNGHFVRDTSGDPTGMLHEDAIHRAQARLPGLTDTDYLEGARAAQAHANSRGITGVLDPSIKDYHERAYAALAEAGEMTLRVAGAARVGSDEGAEGVIARLTALRAAHSTEYFHIHSAKFFLDGILENRTAAMLAPYADHPAGNAPLMFLPAQIASMFTALDAARFQIHVHVIGDLAARAALDGFEAALHANGPWPSLHQLAHLQVVDPADFPRIASLAVMANIQPLWARHEPGIIDPTLAMIGPKRGPNTYAFRKMLANGAAYCLSSDWPVTTLNPFEIIETAVTRQPPRRAGSVPAFHPNQRLTVAEAVLGYTTHAAAACWRGHFTGRLSPGFSADLIVLDRDILTCEPQEISDTKVLLTLFQGAQVHYHPSFENPN
jgi:predicted amidohydrolase YtcJ